METGKSEIVLKETGLSWLTLFAASGTVICCALPIVLVALGLGTAVAALSSSFPVLITIAQQKTWVFTTSGVLMLLSGWFAYRPGQTCPAEPELARICSRAQLWNRRIYWSAVALWGVGFFAAYLALPLRIWLES